jgi:hypothetical protein
VFSRPVIYAFLGMCLYAAQNVVIEVRLSKYTTMALLLYWYFTLLPLAVAGLGYMYLSGQTITMPNRSDAMLIAAVGVMFFFADLLYIGAYTNGGSLLAITTLAVLFPAVALLIKHFWVGGDLNYYHLAGYILAAIAVILISIGSAIR